MFPKGIPVYSRIHRQIFKQERIEQSKWKLFLWTFRIYFYKQMSVYVMWLAAPHALHYISGVILVLFMKGRVFKSKEFEFSPSPLARFDLRVSYSLWQRFIAHLIPTAVLVFIIASAEEPGPLLSFYY